MNHTPGPWEFRYLSGAQYSMVAGKDSVVAGIPNTDSYAPDDLPTILANGRLVAAAPALLAVAQFVVQATAGNIPPGIVEAAREAIAQAASIELGKPS